MTGWVIVLSLALATGVLVSSEARAGKVLLKPDRFVEALKADSSQAARVASLLDSLRAVVGDYRRTRGWLTFEGRLWNGEVPTAEALRALDDSTRAKVSELTDSLDAALDDGQMKRLRQELEEKFSSEMPGLPFHAFDNSPLNKRFNPAARAYHVALPGEPDPECPWSYAALLDAWTARGFAEWGQPRTARTSGNVAVDGVAYEQSPFVQSKLVPSPLLVAATLLVPDLATREFDLLWEYGSPAGGDRAAAWARYVERNPIDGNILVRVRLATAQDEFYVDAARYTIYLEDSEGVGYEPVGRREVSYQRQEGVASRVLGTQVGPTHTLGTGIPFYGLWDDASATLRYSGREKLLALSFPARDLSGRPGVTERSDYLKLVIRPNEEEFPPITLVWDMRREPPRRAE